MSHLKFSIIIPSYNQGQFLEEAILSVLNQNYPELELFIIDGGSMDQSVEVIKKYDHSITYWVSESDKGQTNAINKGIKKATGDIITWLNSDDIYEDNALHRANKYFINNPDVALIHGKTTVFGDKLKPAIMGHLKKNMENRYLAYIPFPQPSSFFRKQIIDQFGLLNEELHYAMDFELLSVIYLSYPVLYCDEMFSRYRMHDTSKSNDVAKFANEWGMVFSKSMISIGENAEHIVKSMKKYNIFTEPESKFVVGKKFSKTFLDLTYCYFLNQQFHSYYQASDFGVCEVFSNALLDFSPQFYKDENVKQHVRKYKVLGKHLINFLRKIRK